MTQAPFEVVLLSALMTPAFMNTYFDDAIEFGNLYKALKKSCRNIRWKDSVVGYEANGLRNTYKLRRDLLQGKYKISPYQHFKVYEPKEREIVATRIRDRQFQKALCDCGLYIDITEHLIHDDGACQNKKGTDFTLDRMVAHLRRYYKEHGADGWVLKCDIQKFFPSTKHDVAKAAIRKRVSDSRAADVVCEIIDSFDGDVGIGLGSQVSQLVELAVLDDLDHFIKENLHIKHYLRYMDDFVLIHHDKDYLKECLRQISEFVSSIGFILNEKTAFYPLRQGVKMLNWHFYLMQDTGRVVKKMNRKKMGKQRRKMRKLIDRESDGTLREGTSKESLAAWMANAKRGDTFYNRQRMTHYYYQVKGESKRYERQDETCQSRGGVQSVA